MMAGAGSRLRETWIDLAETPDFDLGNLRVRPSRRQVFRGNALCRDLEPRVMQVLVALASARPEVISRDRLIESCWNGRIVGDDAINRCIVALRHLARETAPQPFSIETVPRVGYYLVEPKRFRPTAGAGTGPPPSVPVPPSRAIEARIGLGGMRFAALLAALALVALAIAMPAARLPSPRRLPPSRRCPSATLPATPPIPSRASARR